MKIICLYSLFIFSSTFAMHEACYRGNPDDVQWFIDHEYDVNHKNKFGLTPLMMAVQMYNHAIPAQTYYDMVTLLISVGAKPELAAHDERTAVDFCMQNTGGTPAKIVIRENIKKLLEYHATIF